ncbi:immunoglobulin I-set domain protein, partial [Opisthorchis viverrini]
LHFKLWDVLEDLQKRSREVDTYDLSSIANSIKGIESGLDKVEARLISLNHELERLKVILIPTDAAYLGQLENVFNEACKTASERVQDMRIQKLVLRKHSKLLECENNVQESVGWIEELSDNVGLLYRENCVGKNQLEASELLDKCGHIYKQAKTTYAYSSQLLETYSKLCEADGRKVPRILGSCRNRLVRVWPRLQHRLREFKERTEAAESVYTHSDLLLNRVQEYLLNATRNPVAFDRVCDSMTEDVQVVTDDQHRKQIDSLLQEFQHTKTLALTLLERLPRGLLADDSEFTGPVIDEISRLMRLRLYTLWLKLREYEVVVLGYNTADSTTASELGMDTIRPLARSRSATSTVRPRESPFGGFEDFVNNAFYSPVQAEPGRRKYDAEKPERDIPKQSDRRPGTGSGARPIKSVTPPMTQPTNKPKADYRSRSPDLHLLDAQKSSNETRASKETKTDSALSITDEVVQHLKTVLKQMEARLKEMNPENETAFDEIRRQQLRNDADRELVRLENQINDALNTTQHPPSSTLKDMAGQILEQGRRAHRKWLTEWKSWVPTAVNPKDMQRIRLRELETDIGECQNRLYDLINAVCLTTAQNAEAIKSKEPSNLSGSLNSVVVTDEDVKRINMVCEETQGMKETIPAQEEFISNLLSDCRQAQHLKAHMDKAETQWRRYKKCLGSFDSFVKCLERGYLLLVRSRKFATQRDSCLKDLKNKHHEIPNLQVDGRMLENNISHWLASGLFQSAAAQVTQSTKARPSIQWLISQLTRNLDQLRDAMDELDMLAANIRSGSSQDNVDLNAILPNTLNSAKSELHTLDNLDNRADTLRTPSLTRLLPSGEFSGNRTPVPAESLEIPPPLPPRLGKLPMHGDALKAVSSQTLSLSTNETKRSGMTDIYPQWRITQPLNDISCRADDDAVLRCGFAGPKDKRSFSVSWTFRPFVYTPDGVKVGQKSRIPKEPGSIVEEMGTDYAQLLFKAVDPSRSGYYTMRIKNLSTGNAMKSSGKVIVRPYFTKEMHDATVPIVDPKTGRLGTVKFSVTFRGFACAPRVQWSHDGDRLNPKLWQIDNQKESSTIVSNAAKISDQGLYECRLCDPQSGLELVSAGQLKVDKVREPCAHSPLSIGEAKLGEPLAIRCPLPEGIDINLCEIDWLHNDQTIYTFQPRLLASSRSSSFSRSGSRDNTFQCNETTWRTYVADGCCVLTTGSVHQTDSGDYTCRIHTTDDVYESSGHFTVYEILEFLEPLQPVNVQHGHPFLLHCRLNRPVECTLPSSSGDQPVDSNAALTVEWYLNDTYLNPYKCIRLGTVIQAAKDTLSLAVSKATGDHGGLYRCKVYSNDTQVETQCAVNIQGICEATSVSLFQGENIISCSPAIEPNGDDAPQSTNDVNPNPIVPPKITKYERKPEGSVVAGQSVTIIVQFEADALPTCTWTHEGLPLDNKKMQFEESLSQNACMLSMRNLQQEHSGWYKLVLANDAGWVDLNLHIPVEEPTETDSIHPHIPGSDSMIAQDVISDTFHPDLAHEDYPNVSDVFIIAPSNVSVMAGETVKLLCVISLLDSCYSVNWARGDTVLVAGSDTLMYNGYPREGIFSLEIKNLKSHQSGLYTVTAVRRNAKQGSPRFLSVAQTTFWLNVTEPTQSIGLSSTGHYPPCLLDKQERMKQMHVQSGGKLDLSYTIRGNPAPESCWIKDKTTVIEPQKGKIEITHNNYHYGLTVHDMDITDSGLWEFICHNPYNFLVLSRTIDVSPIKLESVKVQQTMDSSPSRIQDTTGTTSKSIVVESPQMKQFPSERGGENRRRSSLALVTNGTGETRPPDFKAIFTDLTCRTGETVRLMCRIDGCPTPMVTWSFDGKPIDTFGKRFREEKRGDEYTLIIEGVTQKEAGRYLVTAENVVGVATCSGNLFVRSISINRLTRPRSEESILPLCSHCYTPFKTPEASPYSAMLDEDSVFFAKPSIYATVPRHYAHPVPRDTIFKTDLYHSSCSRPRSLSAKTSRATETIIQREIPIKLAEGKEKPPEKREVLVPERGKPKVVSVFQNQTRNTLADEKKQETQFSTVESSECE